MTQRQIDDVADRIVARVWRQHEGRDLRELTPHDIRAAVLYVLRGEDKAECLASDRRV